jgi:hydroxyacylglutathione hydrolase
MLNIETVFCLNDNYSYIINDKTSNTVGVIDPSEFKPIDDLISTKYKKLDYILNTHHHQDHIGGNQDLKNKYNSKIVGSEIDKTKIYGMDVLVNEGDILKFGNTEFKIIHVPGHTNGHISFYSKEAKIIFTGDALFSLGCGRLFEGSYQEMYSSLIKIKNLPKHTKIYCGHEYTKSNYKFCLAYDGSNKMLAKKLNWINSRLNKNLPTIPVTLEEELNTNIFLRCDNIAIKKQLEMTKASDELIFEKLRLLKDNF